MMQTYMSDTSKVKVAYQFSSIDNVIKQLIRATKTNTIIPVYYHCLHSSKVHYTMQIDGIHPQKNQ